MQYDDEIWREIDGFPGYEVSCHGRVRSVARDVATANGQTRHYRGIVFSPSSTNQHGHLKVGLRSGGRLAMRYVHQLVAIAFLGPRPLGMVVAHCDGDPLNNRADNLRFATQKENEADKVRHGSRLSGDSHPRRILSAKDVATIRSRLADGLTQQAIATEFGVCRATISAISTGRSWGAYRFDAQNRHPATVRPRL